jgi:hypothetical protein
VLIKSEGQLRLHQLEKFSKQVGTCEVQSEMKASSFQLRDKVFSSLSRNTFYTLASQMEAFKVNIHTSNCTYVAHRCDRHTFRSSNLGTPLTPVSCIVCAQDTEITSSSAHLHFFYQIYLGIVWAG